MHKSVSSFFLPSFYDVVSDAMRSINSQVDQRNEEALCVPMRLHRMSPSKKSFTQKTFFTMATYEEVPWMHKPISSFFLSFLFLWHRLGRHEKLRFASEPTQRRSLVYALTPHCLVPRKASYKKYYSPGDLWGGSSMDAQIDLFLPSFFLSFFLLWHRLGRHKKLQFASGPTHRGSLLSLSMLLHRMSLLPRKASHKKTFLSSLLQISSICTNTKIDHRQNVMPNSLRNHHDSTMQTSSNKFLKSLLFPLQWTDLKQTSLCISFSVLRAGGGGLSDHPDSFLKSIQSPSKFLLLPPRPPSTRH